MRRLTRYATLALATLVLLAVAAPAAAQNPTVTVEAPPTETATSIDATVTETETATVTETETETEGSTQRIDLETWHWALLAAGATAVVLIAFGVGRGSRRQRREPLEKTPEARNQMLLAALSGWIAEGWGIESQSSVEAVVRKGTERRLLTVDAHGALNRSELPAVEADPTWIAPGTEAQDEDAPDAPAE